MDAKLAFRLCHLSEIKIMEGESSIKFDASSGRWNYSNKDEDSTKRGTKKRKKVYPMISGVLSSEIDLKQVLLSEVLMNPEKMGWISIDKK
jgi:hypothetical protein